MSRSMWKQWWPLFLVSGLGLFFELAIIRWVSAEVRLLAYFKNFSLLAAFLGLGLGFGLVGRGRDYRQTFMPLLLLFVSIVLVAGRVSSQFGLTYPGGGDEFLWNAAPLSDWISLVLFLSIMLLFFLLTMFLFIPLGQATGMEMARFAPLPAYIVNILASLAGVWAFALLSYLQTPPEVWFVIGLIGWAVYLARQRALQRTALAMLALITVILTIGSVGQIWSPYQRLAVSDLYLPRANDKPVQVGYNLDVQQTFYQNAIDLSPQFLASLGNEFPEFTETAVTYNLPYLAGAEGAKVLIVGAGMGNDVAAALRNGASHVDAVEIDPAILAVGRQLHPEHPYADARVTPIVDDARSFFRHTPEQYDVIAFGLLDSHSLLSGLSSVRLDSFVYTLESFQQVQQHLKPGGIVAVTFRTWPTAPWIGERLGRSLISVFGAEQVYAYQGPLGTTFIVGDLPAERLAALQLTPWQPAADAVPLATDDWPYLYLRTQRIPDAYWQALLLVGVACLLLIRRLFPQAMRPDWQFFLLGAAFLLVEFKSVTEFALLFGTTWLVNALAISGVLLMVLAANLVVLSRPRLNVTIAYALLFASLIVTALFPLDVFNTLPFVLRAILSMITLSLPLFFAGLIFGELIRRAGETAGPLASNLVGSVAGGVLEYGSLLWGIKSQYGIAALVYLGAWLASRGKR